MTESSHSQPHDHAADEPQLLEDLSLKPARNFVGRDQELRLIEQCLIQLHDGQEPEKSVITFFGVPGIGKSALLAEAAARGGGYPQIYVVQIDLSRLYRRRRFPASPLAHFLQAFRAWPPVTDRPEGARFLRALHDLGESSADGSDAQLEAALGALTELMAALDRRILLLIDSCDYAPDELPPWLERMLMVPLLLQRRLMAIFASQMELRWWSFQTRSRAELRELGTLSQAESVAQVGLSSEHAETVYRLTVGYPLANERVYELLGRHGQGYLARTDELLQGVQETIKGEIIAAIPNLDEILASGHPELISNLVTEIKGRIVEGIGPNIERVLGTLAIFRQFDVTVLRAILPRFYPEFEHYSQSSLLLLLRGLLDTRLATWNQEKRAYQVNPTIRRIFSEALRLNNPSHYRAIHQGALEYYRSCIQRFAERRPAYVVEYIFHLLYREPDDSYTDTAQLRAELSELLGFLALSDEERRTALLTSVGERLATDAELHDDLAYRRFELASLQQLLVEL